MNYRSVLAEADAYFRIVSKSLSIHRKLGNKVLFGICTMMIEKYLVALLMAHGKAVNGHNISSLVANAHSGIKDLPFEILELAKVDERLDLCGFSPVNSAIPSDAEMEALFANLVVLKEFVYQSIEVCQKTEYLSF
jgi:hypothetical protein